MSPSYPPLSRTPNPFAMKVMSPNPQINLTSAPESPSSPSKTARHRIRPVPVIPGQRRNSVQVVGEEDNHHHHQQQLHQELPFPPRPHQRVRHISTSSTTSVTKFVPQQVGRIRTESTCSAYSDVSVFKPRRATRSEDYIRLCEARTDLLRKCNGEAPDRTQLRMYDMIYYNPKANPMKKAVEPESDGEGQGNSQAKERRMSTSSSVKSPQPPSSSTFKDDEPQVVQQQEPKTKAEEDDVSGGGDCD